MSDSVPTLLFELENKAGYLNKKRLNEYRAELNQEGNIPKEAIILDICSICHVSAFKYKCPRCSIKTCSLACSKAHKSQTSCSGIKDLQYAKTITDVSELMTDVKYLSGMINSLNTVSKKNYNLLTEANSSNTITTKEETIEEIVASKEKKLKNFAKLCKKFRAVTFEKCPTNLSRFKENQSYCDSKNQKFYWTSKIYFLDFPSESGFTSHLFKDPYDDSLVSIHEIALSLSNDTVSMVSTDLIQLALSEEFKAGKFEIYVRIGKIEYENLRLRGKSDFALRHDNFNYFLKLSEAECSLRLKDYLKGKIVKDYVDLYLKMHK